MVIENEFVARFFSNDSSHLHPENTLSSFIVEFDTPLDLGDDQWEVGVCQMYLNPLAVMNITKKTMRDVVTLNDSRDTRIVDIDDFAKWLIEHSLYPQEYKREYFYKYLDKTIEFVNYTWDYHFASENWDSVKDMEKKAIFDFNLKALLKEGETLNDFKIPHLNEQKLETVEIKIPTGRGDLRMLNIFNLCVKSIVRHTRYNKFEMRSHAKIFFEQLGKGFDSQKQLNKARHHHFKSTNLLVHRFIEKLVDAIQTARTEYLEPNETEPIRKESQFLMLYTDIIKHQIVGPSLARILYMIPFDGTAPMPSFTDERVRDVQYARLERTKFKSITFEFRNEHGEFLPFVGGYSPNHVALHFRKIL